MSTFNRTDVRNGTDVSNEPGVKNRRVSIQCDGSPGGLHWRYSSDLLKYCERDTWAMVKLLEKLGELARSVG
jgi:hypothetical protein